MRPASIFCWSIVALTAMHGSNCCAQQPRYDDELLSRILLERRIADGSVFDAGRTLRAHLMEMDTVWVHNDKGPASGKQGTAGWISEMAVDGDFESAQQMRAAIAFLQRVQDEFKRRGKHCAYMGTLLCKAEIHKQLKDFDDALDTYDLAIQSTYATHDRVGLKETLAAKGRFFSSLELWGKAKECSVQLKELYAIRKDTMQMVQEGLRLAELEMKEQNWEHALWLLRDARRIFEAEPVRYRLMNGSRLHAQLAMASFGQGDSLAVQAALDELTRIALEEGPPSMQGETFGYIGMIQDSLRRLELAFSSYEQAYRAYEKFGLPSMMARSLVSMAVAKLKLGRIAEAEKYAHQAIVLIHGKPGLAGIERTAAKTIFSALSEQGDWKEAYRWRDRYERLEDSLLSVENERKKVRFQLMTVVDDRMAADSLAHVARVNELNDRRSLERLRADNNRNRAWTVGFGAFLLLGGGAAYYRVDRKRRQARADRRAAELEIRALRAQMNPHFLFNALNSIHDHMLEHEPEEAADYLARFSKLMRQVLESSRLNEVTLARELDILKGYIELERMRLRGKFYVEIVVAPDVDQQTTTVPPLILQPFVENAIWHGLSRKEGKGLLRIEVTQRTDALVVAIQDDGVGREAPQATAATDEGKTSLGTTITRDRLELLATQRGAHAGFEFVPVAEGTRVVVVLPLAS